MLTNAMIYRITAGSEATVGAMIEKLPERPFQPVPPSREVSMGFVPPHTDAGDADDEPCTLWVSDRFLFFCVRMERRALIPAAVAEVLKRRVEDIEARQGRKVFRKERLALKDEIVADLLPRCLVVPSRTLGYVDIRQQVLVIDTATASHAELILNLVREVIGGLRVMPPVYGRDPAVVMSNWLRNWPDELDLAPGNALRLQSTLDESESTVITGDLRDSDLVEPALDSGFDVNLLRVRRPEVAFSIPAKGNCVRRIKWSLGPTEDDFEADEDRFAHEAGVRCLQINAIIQLYAESFGLQVQAEAEAA